MASLCRRVKNPCKICLGNVTHKTGIQCEGACRSWVHYKCLSFTPGKISDIKRGLIIVSCPCPDCTTDMPKEIIRDEPFSCTNAYCPANMPPKCINATCPSNALCPPPGHNSLLAIPQQSRPNEQYGPCTIDTCKTSRVSPTHQNSQRQSKCCNDKNRNLSPCISCCSGGDINIRKVECVTQTPKLSPCPLPQMVCPPPVFQPQMCPPPMCPPPMCPPPMCPPPPCPPPPCPPPPCSPPPCSPRSRPQSQKFKHNNKQTAKKNTAAIKAMERMCSTMGQLTCQLNNLMDKMQQALSPPSQSSPPCAPPPCPGPPVYNMPSSCIPHTNSCSLTQLPCCCPSGKPSGMIDQDGTTPCPSSLPPRCLQDQADDYDSQSQQPCYCASNPLRRNEFDR